MFNVPERYRVKRGPFRTELADGNNGYFVIPSMGGSMRTHYQCVASDMGHKDMQEEYLKIAPDATCFWEHLSVSIINISHSGQSRPVDRCPTWEEMCYLKELFWDDPEDVAIEIHPPESEYVSEHHFCLHLWRPVDKDGKPITLPRPHHFLLGTRPKTTPNPTPNETPKSESHPVHQSTAAEPGVAGAEV